MYILAHWQGRHSLRTAFWWNLVAVSVLVNLVEITLVQPRAGSAGFVSVAAAYLLVARGLVFAWQAVGLVRSCERSLRDHLDGGWVTGAYAGLVASVVIGLTVSFGTFQSLVISARGRPAPLASDASSYTLGYDRTSGSIRLSGVLDHGLTRDLRALLAAHPAAHRIVLNSPGGQIFEARGAAREVMRSRLDAYVAHRCESACTTVFMAGERRYLGRHGRLGFHGYRFEARQENPFMNAAREQDEDRRFFRERGMTEAFAARIFSVAPSGLWVPEPRVLIAGGVVHEVVPGPPYPSPKGSSE